MNNDSEIMSKNCNLNKKEINHISSDDKNNTKVNINNNDRRKRINRMKTIILIVVLILLILPTICCIILGFQVSKLQKQVNNLAAIHNLYDISDANKEANYAYAAVKSNSESEENNSLITPAVGAENQESKTKNQKNDASNQAQPSDIKKESNDTSKNEGSNSTKGIYSGKKVYLTFDDGPSIYTNDILDVLSEHNIKATFFVIGKTDTTSKKIYKRIVNEGHTLGMHSYSHDYKIIYNSFEDFDKDFTKVRDLLYDTTGYKPSIYRFPGGSDNLVNKNGMDKFIRYLNKASIVYFDWNVVNGDATNIEYTEEQLVDNVLNGVASKETSIVLMHDSQTKKLTADSLPELIQALLSGGAQILPLDENVTPIQMIKADSVK